MINGKQKEIIVRALKAYQKQLTAQIEFHNGIEQVASVRTPLIAELKRVWELLDHFTPHHSQKRRARKTRK